MNISNRSRFPHGAHGAHRHTDRHPDTRPHDHQTEKLQTFSRWLFRRSIHAALCFSLPSVRMRARYTRIYGAAGRWRRPIGLHERRKGSITFSFVWPALWSIACQLQIRLPLVRIHPLRVQSMPCNVIPLLHSLSVRSVVSMHPHTPFAHGLVMEKRRHKKAIRRRDIKTEHTHTQSKKWEEGRNASEHALGQRLMFDCI